MAFLKDKIEIGIEEAQLNAQSTFSSYPKAAKWYIIIVLVLIVPTFFAVKLISQKILVDAYQKNLPQAKPSFTSAQPIKYSDVTVINQGQDSYTGIVQITNQNLDLSVEASAYKFNFYN